MVVSAPEFPYAAGGGLALVRVFAFLRLFAGVSRLRFARRLLRCSSQVSGGDGRGHDRLPKSGRQPELLHLSICPMRNRSSFHEDKVVFAIVTLAVGFDKALSNG